MTSPKRNGRPTITTPERSAELRAKRKHPGPVPRNILRQVQDAMEDPTLIEGERESMIERAFKALSDGVNWRDPTGRPDSAMVKLAFELWAGKNGKAPGEYEYGGFNLIVVRDDRNPPALGILPEGKTEG